MPKCIFKGLREEFKEEAKDVKNEEEKAKEMIRGGSGLEGYLTVVNASFVDFLLL